MKNYYITKKCKYEKLPFVDMKKIRKKRIETYKKQLNAGKASNPKNCLTFVRVIKSLENCLKDWLETCQLVRKKLNFFG